MTEEDFKLMVATALASGVDALTLGNALAVSRSTVLRWANGRAVPAPEMREPVRDAINRLTPAKAQPFTITTDAEPYTVTFGPTTPAPEDFALSIELTWLSRDAGVAVADVRIHTSRSFVNGSTYWLKTLIGPDGHHDLDQRLYDAVSFNGPAIKQHGFTYGQIIAAVRQRWSDERATR